MCYPCGKVLCFGNKTLGPSSVLTKQIMIFIHQGHQRDQQSMQTTGCTSINLQLQEIFYESERKTRAKGGLNLPRFDQCLDLGPLPALIHLQSLHITVCSPYLYLCTLL